MPDMPDVDPKHCPEVTRAPERWAFGFARLREYGVLWLINRTVFNPRGFAISLEYEDGNPEPFGWSLHGTGEQPWTFDGFDEAGKLAAIEGLLNQAREFGVAPHIGPEAEHG